IFVAVMPEAMPELASVTSLASSALKQEELFPIREVSRLTGVNPVTLRAWERRYGLIQPTRTDSGHRLYSQADIDAVRSILDGHVVLSRTLANAGRFPAVDVLASVSRLFTTLATPAQQSAARQVRAWLQRYSETEDLVRIGAYQPGADPETDIAVQKYPALCAFLAQAADEPCAAADALQQLYQLAGVSA
ncbi:MAG: MerR family DNA-binding transcriptional regulator, partial [Alicyclobacillus sp.]|nr:MerR family DNA-binding transcriptional regulator [Alicyclobacillus sp.]